VTFALILAASALGAIVWGSLFEWTLHRFVMHRPFLGMTYPYRTHGITHHTVFGSAKDYHLQDHATKHLVTMAWWNGPVLLLVNAPAAFAAAWIAGTWWAILPFMATLTSYYVAYEYLHWCMHVPEPRWFQGTRLFKWIDRHHRLHHLMPMRNLNVVFPIADWMFRTRIARAPVPAET
jgi:hypothetical protein